MTALTAFVTARLDEDETAAKWASAGPWKLRAGGYVVGGPDDRDGRPAVTVAAQTQQWNGQHIARHDPARALREVAAKRKRLAAYIAARAAADRYDDQYMAGVASGLADAIKDDADAWSDHPDYDQKWST